MFKQRFRPMKNKRYLHIGLFLFVLGFMSGFSVSFLRSAPENAYKYLDQFHYVYQTIKGEYVEETDPSALFRGAITGMLRALDDPYSRYLGPDDYADFREDVTGQFTGIGVEITMRDNEIVVISPIEDAPAYKAGIRSGDVILQVDGVQLKADNVDEVMKKIRQPETAGAKLLVRRSGALEPIEFDIRKAPIHVKSVKAGPIAEAESAYYIKVTHFYGETHREFEKALAQASAYKRLVLDLRDNPGGNMEAAIAMADMLLPEGKPIMSTRGRAGAAEEYRSTGKQKYSGELILLVNGGSASASEILAGAIKDNGRARLIGQKTFGKALVQRMIDIEPEKAGFTLTIRKYYTPSGAMIHKKGIEPDIAVSYPELTQTDCKNIGRIFNDGIIAEAAKSGTYSDGAVEELMKRLAEAKLPLSRPVAAYHLHNEINRTRPAPLYDLTFDLDLKRSLAYITNGK